MPKYVILILCSILLLHVTSLAQVFQRLTEDNGLPTNYCNDMIQDTFGLVWIATESGLVRYDGKFVKVYYSDPDDSTSISSNSIRTLHAGAEGSIWASTDDGILNQYNLEEDCFHRHFIRKIEDFPDQRIYDMTQQDSILWLAAENGLITFHIPSGKSSIINPAEQVENSNHPFLQTVYALHLDRMDQDLIWVGTRAGLTSYRVSTGEMRFHTQYIPEIKDRGLYAVTEIYQDKSGLIWSSISWSGISAYDPEQDTWRRYFDGYYPVSAKHNAIRSILPKSENEFWIASPDNGFGVFSQESGTYAYFQHDGDNPYSVQSAPVNILIRDQDSNIWACGSEGVSFYNPAYQQVHVIDLPPKRISHPIAKNRVTSFAKISDRDVLIGSYSGDGLYISDMQNGDCHVVESYAGKSFQQILSRQTLYHPTDLQVYDLLRISDEQVWVAMDTQFAYFHIPSRQLIFPEQTNSTFFKQVRINSLQLGPDGYLWGLNSSHNAIFKSDPKTGAVIRKINLNVLLPDTLGVEKQYRIRDFRIDQDGLIWYHTYRRVLTHDIKTGKTKILPLGNKNQPGTTGVDFYNISITDSGTVLLSCKENGMQIIRRGEDASELKYELVGLRNGLPIEQVVRVVSQGRNAWLATRKGIVRYNLDNGEVRIYDKSTGLPDHDLLNYWVESLDLSDEGILFFGHPDKFSWLDTRQLYRDSIPFKILFTGIDVHGVEKILVQNILLSDRIDLNASETFFTLQYASDDFTRPDQQHFKYRLAGYDSEWVDAGDSRSATYTKVPGGNYTFEVLGANSSGVWMHEPARMEIHVDTPFFQSNLFYFLILLVALALVYFAYRYRMKQVRDREKLKAEFSVQLAEVEMTALRAQMNPHFVFNSLNSINKYILTNEPRIASRYLTKFSQLMRLILNNSKSKSITLEDEISALSLYVEMEQVRFEHKFEFKKSIHILLSPSSIMIPPMLIQPYIENAIWHGLMPLQKPGILGLEIRQEGNHLICVIEDNGIGRKKAMEISQRKGVRKKSMGMQITSDRIALVEALHNIRTKIDIEDKYDREGRPEGTRVTLTLPIEVRPATDEIKSAEK